MVAPQIVGSATTYASTVSGATIVLDKPAGVADGDLLVAVLRTNGSSSPTDFALSGWTRRGYTFVPNDAAGRVTGIYTHPVTSAGSEPSTYTFTKSVSDTRRVGAMFIVRGVDLTSPVAGNSTGWDATPSPRVQLNSFTVDTSDAALLVYAWANEIVSPNATAPTILPGTEVALVPSSAGTGATRTTIWAGYESNAATSTGNKNLTWAVATSGPSATGVVLRGLAGVTTTASGSLSVSGSATAVPGVNRAGSGALGLAGSATRAVGVSGAAPAGLTITGSAVVSVAVSRTAVGTLDVSGAGSTSVAVERSVAGVLLVSGAASGTILVSRTAAGALTISGSADTLVNVVRTAVGVLELAGAGFVLRDIPDVRTLLEVVVVHALTPLSVTRTLEDA